VIRAAGIRAGYGQLEVLHGVSLHVPEGALVAVIGANGAGKSTLLQVMAGLLPARGGRIYWRGAEVERWLHTRAVGAGAVLVPEGRGLFPAMSVRENLELGAPGGLLRSSVARGDLERVLELFPRLRERQRQTAGTLSGGEQQMLAIGRALAGLPQLLMLDEPSAGLAPMLVREVLAALRTLREQGMTMLMVEQNAALALAEADYAYVMETGRIVLQGKGRELADNPKVAKAYLGE